uniref:Uncharacterized conserved protein, DUF4415 family n=1 Tax=Candidatus Kentrum eta TaxID=2126337 RepID=A0A450UCE4_9GAMM|nr:MAG: Uncharacterized conserved protein, DUF4415 family [Candidatus Kentron sp. H]VFJ90913.1 MAG: Uncharacterized conserved protein, DUF4415 family [Candidatus Kentron sp. H]VFJ97923.1 MAG: Uncharacterized conserved protein, DUF4415 family [Candidatus Kentron sp. H]
MSETSTFPISQTATSKTDIERLRTMKDSDIVIDDDAPAWTPEMFSRVVAQNGSERPPHRQVVSLSLDTDVIRWFRAQSHDHQAYINALLRAHMQAHQ